MDYIGGPETMAGGKKAWEQVGELHQIIWGKISAATKK